MAQKQREKKVLFGGYTKNHYQKPAWAHFTSHSSSHPYTSTSQIWNKQSDKDLLVIVEIDDMSVDGVLLTKPYHHVHWCRGEAGRYAIQKVYICMYV